VLFAASLIATGLEHVIDEVVKPYVKSTPGTEDDAVVSKVEYWVDGASRVLSFFSLRLGRK
jgi:hypothetical protein